MLGKTARICNTESVKKLVMCLLLAKQQQVYVKRGNHPWNLGINRNSKSHIKVKK